MQGTTVCRIFKSKQYFSKKQVHQAVKKMRREPEARRRFVTCIGINLNGL